MNGQWGRSLVLPQHQCAFTFSASLVMPRRLSFSRQSSPPTPDEVHSKRPRPLADVDGEGSGGQQKKKRRLRLVLVTSRLSSPFSSPPTHIVARGSSKIAIWAKQKALGRSLLRKAAILNRIRKHARASCSKDPSQLCIVRQMIIFFSRSNSFCGTAESALCTNPPAPRDSSTWTTGECRRATSPSNLRNEHLPPCNSPSPPSTPRRQYIPLPPSPLYLTNYDIFDNEDGYFDSDSDTETEGDGRNSRIYSDFNILEPSEPVLDDHDAIASFDSLTFGSQFLLTEMLTEDEKSIGTRLEQKRQKEVSFVHFGF
ncbi:hypothetical protein I7I53_03127 [Histoplasma capsulatum var. duboisii H88]|uniref:Uncharacterized protein n=1 Tax=Ajellomyces capsulatus (strain H88) TaxID=544711 RepID=A0A8A1LQ92_AJEC8|nr:hypothetical protein I7I53_03127 [Histoplasma capsulatum var. duboisii H88]